VIACKYCLLPGGAGVSMAKGVFKSDDELFDHIEEEHDLIIRRKDETAEEAKARVEAKNPRIGGPDCRCPDCLGNKVPGVRLALDLMESVASRRSMDGQ